MICQNELLQVEILLVPQLPRMTPYHITPRIEGKFMGAAFEQREMRP